MNRFNKIRSVVVILVTICPAISIGGQFKVTRVHDCDTIKAIGQGYTITVRLVGIDASETSKKKGQAGQPYSQKSKTQLIRLVLNKMVEIEGYGIDRYSRVLAFVYVDGRNVNLEMVKEGLAEVYRGKPAKGFGTEPFWKSEEEAKKAKRGMWQSGEKYVSPREWRRMHKN